MTTGGSVVQIDAPHDHDLPWFCDRTFLDPWLANQPCYIIRGVDRPLG